MPAEKTEKFRKEVFDRMKAWRWWKSFHSNVHLILGTFSSALTTLVAINSKLNLFPNRAWFPALLAAVLTFIISTLGAQAEAKAFELGARMLEAGLAKYDSDPDFGDRELGKVLATAIQTLNKKT